MPALLPAAQLGSTYLDIAGIKKVFILQIHFALLERSSQGNDFEGGPWLVSHPDRQVAVIDLCVIFLVRTRFISRSAGHGQNFAILRIHRNGPASLGLILHHRLIQLAFHNGLNLLVDRQLQIKAVLGSRILFRRTRH
ncbi:hypothetical protein D3C76_196000 [compost metagenome]